jgi:hypothetical protein
MNRVIMLVVLGLLGASRMTLLAGAANGDDAGAGTESTSAAQKPSRYGVPPGLQKRGALPPRHENAGDSGALQSDLHFPFNPETNAVVVPRGVSPTVYVDDKRVQSPRGSEVLPLTAPPTPEVTKPVMPSTPQPVTAQEERDLAARLLKVIVPRTASLQRNNALTRIAAESGTTVKALEDQLSLRPNLPGGDLLMGNKIASLSNRPAEEVYAAHDKAKGWLATGEDFGVAPSILQETAARFVEASR